MKLQAAGECTSQTIPCRMAHSWLLIVSIMNQSDDLEPRVLWPAEHAPRGMETTWMKMMRGENYYYYDSYYYEEEELVLRQFLRWWSWWWWY